MTPVFADTSYFIALLSPADAHHDDARAFSHANVRPFILTSAIVLELGAAFSKGQLRQGFRDLMELLLGDDTELVHVDEALQQRGLELFYARSDKNWSLTDCISFLLKDRELMDAATTDEHFRQAGFTILLPNVGES